jgi:hypothetical protein
MKKNVGGIDKTLRIILGIVLFIVGIAVQMNTGWRIGILVIAGIALVTGFVNF